MLHGVIEEALADVQYGKGAFGPEPCRDGEGVVAAAGSELDDALPGRRSEDVEQVARRDQRERKVEDGPAEVGERGRPRRHYVSTGPACSAALRDGEAGGHGVAQPQESMRLIDRLAYELQLVHRVPRPAHATLGELFVGQRPVGIAEELQRPGGVGGEVGHAIRFPV